MKKIISVLLLVGILVGCSSCSKTGVVKATVDFENEALASEALEQLGQEMGPSINHLGYEVMAELQRIEPNDNVLVSPLSLSMALSMLQNGATGATKDEIVSLIGNDPSINENNTQLLAYLNGKDSEALSLSIANSYWMRHDLTPNQTFVDTLEKYYDAGYHTVDFMKADTVPTMNQWVEDKTKGMLKNTFDGFDRDTLSVLVNTVYFKGGWSDTFPEALTKQQDFHVSDGSIKVPMMTQQHHLRYNQGSDEQTVILPYKNGMSFVILLPDGSVNEWLENHTAEDMNAIMAGDDLNNQAVRLSLPKFEYETKMDLKTLLMALGMEKAFIPEQAEFTEIIEENQPVWVDKIFQKTRIILDEEGTEAAAVTVVEMKTTSAEAPEEAIVMVCDRPFIFAIIEDQTDLPLFMGIYSGK